MGICSTKMENAINNQQNCVCEKCNCPCDCQDKCCCEKCCTCDCECSPSQQTVLVEEKVLVPNKCPYINGECPWKPCECNCKERLDAIELAMRQLAKRK